MAHQIGVSRGRRVLWALATILLAALLAPAAPRVGAAPAQSSPLVPASPRTEMIGPGAGPGAGPLMDQIACAEPAIGRVVRLALRLIDAVDWLSADLNAAVDGLEKRLAAGELEDLDGLLSAAGRWLGKVLVPPGCGPAAAVAEAGDGSWAGPAGGLHPRPAGRLATHPD